MRLLGIDVDPSLLERWVGWLAPAVQPFFVATDGPRPPGVGDHEVTPELRDTYRLWRVDRTLDVVWLDEAAFADRPRSERGALVRAQVTARRGEVPTVRSWADVLDPAVLRSLGDGHRFVWWPSVIAGNAAEILRRMTTTGFRPSRHDDVASSTWTTCADVLPGARRLAGTYPTGSGPNCFGTVMAAAGVEGAEDRWMVREPFLDWLAATATRGGDDTAPGTVLVWRDTNGLPVHAAVTIGDGWALEKPSQKWWTPRFVLPVRDLIRGNRWPGQRLERHRLRGG